MSELIATSPRDEFRCSRPSETPPTREFLNGSGMPQRITPFDDAVSLQINCEGQEEVDYYWELLTDGGEEGPCGWLKDRYGLSWQVVRAGMEELFSDPDPERTRRAMEAMLLMRKLDVAALQAAADGVAAG